MSLRAQKRSFVDTRLPVGLFIACLAAIVAATFYYAPSWGLMDDFGLLKMAREFKADPWNVHVVTENFITSGMLRPFYYSWAAVFYGVFENWPVGFYIFIALGNMAAMVLWGLVFFRFFDVRREDMFWTVLVYPLTFFLFTPFWNIFNYLSLQEKFVVFFAPAAFLFFHRLYQDFNKKDLIWLYAVVFCGLMSKATFVYVPFVLFVYALLDLVIFRYRPQTSWVLVWINGIIFAAYAIFTLTFQIQGNYTAKYKGGLAGGAFLGKILGLSVVMKSLLVLGIVGLLGVVVYAKLKKKPDVSMACIIYLALMTYIVLLLPWGFQSYLISAMGPLALGGLFPVYAWLNQKGYVVKNVLNSVLVVLLCLIFAGNIVPNIRRMGEIGHTIAYLNDQKGNDMKRYFMPPPYVESADATRKFTGHDLVYCGDGKITADMLDLSVKNYVIFNEMFPSIILSGVKISREVYSNISWKIFEIVPDKDNDETFRVDFAKTFVQQLKVLIREM